MSDTAMIDALGCTGVYFSKAVFSEELQMHPSNRFNRKSERQWL